MSFDEILDLTADLCLAFFKGFFKCTNKRSRCVGPPNRVLTVDGLADTVWYDMSNMTARALPFSAPRLLVDLCTIFVLWNIDIRYQTPPYELAKEWLIGRELVEYREAWQEAKVTHVGSGGCTTECVRLMGTYHIIGVQLWWYKLVATANTVGLGGLQQ